MLPPFLELHPTETRWGWVGAAVGGSLLVPGGDCRWVLSEARFESGKVKVSLMESSGVDWSGMSSWSSESLARIYLSLSHRLSLSLLIYIYHSPYFSISISLYYLSLSSYLHLTLFIILCPSPSLPPIPSAIHGNTLTTVQIVL